LPGRQVDRRVVGGEDGAHDLPDAACRRVPIEVADVAGAALAQRDLVDDVERPALARVDRLVAPVALDDVDRHRDRQQRAVLALRGIAVPLEVAGDRGGARRDRELGDADGPGHVRGDQLAAHDQDARDGADEPVRAVRGHRRAARKDVGGVADLGGPG